MEKQMENTQTMSPQTSETRDLIIRLVIVAALLFLFLVGVNTLSASFKLLGGGVAKGLLNISSNAFVSLMAGMLATVLFQSSSVTTAIIVGLVSAGTIGIEGAVPMIMGANLGTSVTNTFVSMGYIRSNDNYKKAFAAATVHDFFNILAVAIIFTNRAGHWIFIKAFNWCSQLHVWCFCLC
jgi:sodium-dependent phosphate cotransporter